MARRHFIIPGHEAALQSEQRERAAAFLCLPELIAGVKVGPLTPYRREWLKVLENPFVIGGNITEGAVAQFVWCVHPDFKPEESAKDAFMLENPALVTSRLIEAVSDIEDYLERAFLDEPTGGKPSVPKYSGTAYLIHEMKAHYNWSDERTMHGSLRVIYQLLRCVADARGDALVNKRSDAIRVAWQDKLNSFMSSAMNEPDGECLDTQSHYHDSEISIALRKQNKERALEVFLRECNE